MGSTTTYVMGENEDIQYKLAFLYKICIVFLVIGALNLLFTGVFNINFIKQIFGEGWLTKIIYIIIGLSALYIMFDAYTYLPFLEPMGFLIDRVPPGANALVEVHVKPGTKILYWAEEQPSSDLLKSVNNSQEAYDKYENTGVTTADYKGKAILKVRRPQSYRVPIRGALKSQVHYRECGSLRKGYMGQVESVYLPVPSINASDLHECLSNAKIAMAGAEVEGFTSAIRNINNDTNAMMVDLAGAF